MKKIIWVGLLLAGLSVARAEKIIPMPFALTATAYVQSAQVELGGVVTVSAPVKNSLTSKTLLGKIAVAENFAGHYGAAAFPDGSSLVWLDYPAAFTNSHFVVMNAGAVICDVSDLLAFAPEDEDSIVFAGGKFNTATGFLTGFKENYVGTVNYDDTASGGSLKFYLAGVVMATGNNTLGTAGTFKETWTAKMSNGVGAGKIGGKSFYMTGGFSATGSGVFSF